MKTNKLFIQVGLGFFALVILMVAYFIYNNKDFLGFIKLEQEQVVTPSDFISTTTPTKVIVSDTPKPVTPVFEPADLPQYNWKLVENKKYGFSYSDLEITPPFSVEIQESSKSLKDFVESIWTLNKYDPNPYTKDKVISQISTSSINGSSAYQFTLSKSFTWDSDGSGYILDEPHLYTFFETKTGMKIITRSPLKSDNDQQPNLYASILSSFRIDENLIPKDDAPTKWQVVDNNFYRFMYPGNLFKIDTEYSSDENIYLTDIVEGMRGGILVKIEDTPFDKNKISGMYGEITDPEEINIGKRLWYSYMWGDAGASARIYLTDLSATQTLRVSFSSMIDEVVYPVVTDIDLQQLILGTFSE